MADIEATYRSVIECINERRWKDLPRYFASESYAAEIKLAGGVEIAVDAITVDRESCQRLAATIIVRFKSARANNEGAAPAGRAVCFMEQHVNWFTEGKLSKTLILVDRDEMQHQLSNPEASNTPDLIGQEPLKDALDVRRGMLSTRELDDTYRAYIGCINAQTMKTELHRFCHPQVVHNTKTLTVDGYRLLIEEAFTAIPDIIFGLHTVIADEKTQRVFARIEFTGTPVRMFAGAKPNGRSVSFCEHVTYRFEEGKIARVWSIVDWESYRAQLQQSDQ
ncbi:SnoaL-domain-containing protein [Hypoxylon fuscum]|nr:SnoaL-domain-containing protein [Hypoxylon fuscum]